LAGAPPAVAATGAVPVPNIVLPPKFEPRLAYGGSQSDCGGVVGSGVPQGATPPSKLAGPAQISVAGSGCAPHVHVEGQLAAVVHGMLLAWQEEVDETVVAHEGGGDDASTALTVTGDASTRMAGSEVVPVEPFATPDPAEPPPEHSVVVSGTHVNPSPQSLATLQGRS
jgi:hypothetical protein